MIEKRSTVVGEGEKMWVRTRLWVEGMKSQKVKATAVGEKFLNVYRPTINLFDAGT